MGSGAGGERVSIRDELIDLLNSDLPHKTQRELLAKANCEHATTLRDLGNALRHIDELKKNNAKLRALVERVCRYHSADCDCVAMTDKMCFACECREALK